MKSASGLAAAISAAFDLVGPQQRVPPLARALRVVHREPGVGDDEVGARHRLQRVALDLDRRARCPGRRPTAAGAGS